MSGRRGIHLDGDIAVGALGQVELDEDDAVVGQPGCGGGEGFEAVDLRRDLGRGLGQRDVAARLHGGGMEVTDFDDGQPALGERRLGHAVGKAAEEEFVGPDAEADGDAVVVPGAGAAAEVEAAAVGDEPRFDFGVGGTEDDGVVAEVGVDVAERRQERGEELVARAIGLAHGQLAPKVGGRSHRLVQGRQGCQAGRGALGDRQMRAGRDREC